MFNGGSEARLCRNDAGSISDEFPQVRLHEGKSGSNQSSQSPGGFGVSGLKDVLGIESFLPLLLIAPLEEQVRHNSRFRYF